LQVYVRIIGTPVTETVLLRAEHAEVQCRPMGRPVTAADLAGLQELCGRSAHESAEESVGRNTARVIEEVGIGKAMEELIEQMADTVLSTKVKVAHPDRMPGLKGPFSKR
jgi:hypothetical protein